MKRMANIDSIPYLVSLLEKIRKEYLEKAAEIPKEGKLKYNPSISSIFRSYIPRNRNLSYHKMRELIAYCEKYNIRCEEIKQIYHNYYFYDKVATVEESASEVFDFSVPNGHSFLGNGLVNHNSTFIRQLGLLVIMAQIGSFIPADSALIGVVDRIFTRMGAYDEISRSVTKEGHIEAPGASTFMVEMREVATICHNATERSLILMDEVGRGTGTFDGLALAWTIAEYIHDHLRARSLLSTHYHQLSSLEEREGIRNFHLAIKETETDLIFLYKVSEGATDKSFGIHCARLAGVPKEIVNRAEHVLKEIERTTEIEIPIFRKRELARKDPKKPKSISDFLD
jgi:DNA mismatch repair protein MutS